MHAAFLFLLVALAFGDDFEQLASLTCEGEVFLYPDHPVLRTRVNVSTFKASYEILAQRMIERLSCPCPGITTDEVDRTRAFYAPEFWLNLLTKRDNSTTCFAWRPTPKYTWDSPYLRGAQTLLDGFDLSHIDWSTCNYDTYKSGQGCNMQIYLPSLDIYLQVAGKKCSSSQYLPYASLSCKGKMCSKMMMPCNSQDDCGASRCHGFGYSDRDNSLVGVGDLLQTLKDIFVYDDNDGDDTDVAVSFYEGLLTWGRKLLYEVTSPFTFSNAYYPFVDFTVCSPSVETLSDDWTNACQVSSNNVVTCPGLKSWDGKLSDGSSVFSADRLDGSKWRTGNLTQQPVEPASPGDLVILDYNCNGQLSMLPNLPPLSLPGFMAAAKFVGSERYMYGMGWYALLGIQPGVLNAPVLNNAFKRAYDYLLSVEQERALLRGEVLSDEAFEFTWSWQQFLYDWVYAPAGVPPVDHGPEMSSLRSYLIDLLNGGSFYQIPLPNTCNYARWAGVGKCSGDYTGFGNLLGMDMTLRISAKSCGGPDAVPAFQIQCVGSACQPLSSPVSCQKTSDCPTGLLCQPLNTQVTSQYNFDALFFASILEPNPNDFINQTRNEKCTGTAYYLKDNTYFLNKLGQTVQNSPSVCLGNYSILQNPSNDYSAINSWLGRAYSGIRNLGNAREVLLNFFVAWLN